MDINFAAAVLGGGQGMLCSVLKNHFDLKKHKIDAKYAAMHGIRQVTSPGFITIQGVAIFMIIFYVCAAPFIMSYLQIPIDMAFTETNGWFTWILHGTENTQWKKIEGFPIGPVHNFLASAVAIYLLGNSGKV